MKKSMNWLVACAGVLALSAGACSRNESQQERRAEEQPGSVSKGELGQEKSEKGSTDIKGSKEVVKRETKTLSESIPTVIKGPEKADINRMGKDDFVALGLSEDSAKKITQYRDKNGDFASVDDLSKVPGLDTQWFQAHRQELGVGTQAAGEKGNEYK